MRQRLAAAQMGNKRGMATSSPMPLKAILFDRDGTLIRDVPYNGDPALVQVMPGAREALQRVRRSGIATGILSNQSGVGRGLLSLGQVASVNLRVEHLLGPFDVWAICPHRAEDNCSCRKPAPGMIREACRQLGIKPSEAAYVGDIGSDMESASAAGARGVMIPTPLTLRAEIVKSPAVAIDLGHAVELLLGSCGTDRT